MVKKERRMFERFAADFPVKSKQLAQEIHSEAQCCDISASGIGLFTGEELTPNITSELLLKFPNGHAPLQTLSRVVWSKQLHQGRWRSGLQFHKIDFMDLSRIFDKADKKD